MKLNKLLKKPASFIYNIFKKHFVVDELIQWDNMLKKRNSTINENGISTLPIYLFFIGFLLFITGIVIGASDQILICQVILVLITLLPAAFMLALIKKN